MKNVDGHHLTERGIIGELRRIFNSPPPPAGMGDDCSVIGKGPGALLLSTDMLSESTHFVAGMTWRERGRMAVSVNLSDIAAMGGRPVALLISLGIPPDMDATAVRRVAAGIAERAAEFGVPVTGGDTKRTGELTIAVTAVGRAGRRLLTRGGARAGDWIAVTGSLGGAAAAYSAWKEGRRGRSLTALTSPEPRVREGMALSDSGMVTAAIDITDGLAASAWYISRASGRRLEISRELIPVSRALEESGADRDALEEALIYWGGDYELLFTARTRRSVDELAARLETPLTVIGRVGAGSGVYLNGERRRRLDERGYDAFQAMEAAEGRN